MIAEYSHKNDKYVVDLDQLQEESMATTEENVVVQKKGLYYDFAEGILEISLIMSSLFFISRKKIFPFFGVILGFIGAIIGIFGLSI